MKQFKIELQYLLLFIALAYFLMGPIPSAQAASSTRYYAGYYGNNTPKGVSSTIYTIDSSVPLFEFFAEWVNIQISYSPNYWVQLGYQQHWILVFLIPVVTLDFYFERKDAIGHWEDYHIFKPIVGHTYTYKLNHVDGDLNWHFKILEDSTVITDAYSDTNPHTYIEIKAFVETSVTSIDIDGSHFNYLKYYTGSNWYLWSYKNSYCTGPYYVDDVSNYEFYAYGGG
ncbi:MAG: hypothetical protein EU533_02625 [Promethearchaeota archaeon]|nr:MAG: hypothetical protein EU533_02625 [Candidatus Lokiarchaeota archaeon]